MADITMCSGADCPLKDNCYRYTANKNEHRQSFFMNVPYNKEDCKCDHYWDNTEYKSENNRLTTK